jgi:hypothetical protein
LTNNERNGEIEDPFDNLSGVTIAPDHPPAHALRRLLGWSMLGHGCAASNIYVKGKSRRVTDEKTLE